MKPREAARKRILFTCATVNQLANAIPVSKKLAEWGIGSHLLSMDPFYRQGVSSAIATASLPQGVEWSSVEMPDAVPPFTVRSWLGKIRLVSKWARSDAKRFMDFDSLVVGMDGAPERVLLSRYRRSGKPTTILWDSLVTCRPRLHLTDPRSLLWASRRWSRFQLRRLTLKGATHLGLEPFVPGLSGHAKVDSLITMGDFVSDAFRDQGVSATILGAGSPRFAESFSRTQSKSSSRGRVLYLTGAFLWHGERYLDECQMADLTELAHSLPKRGWELTIRVHPREGSRQYSVFQGREGVEVSFARNVTLDTDIRRAEVAITAISTAALEAMAASTPVVVYLGRFPTGFESLTLGAHRLIPVCRTVEELTSTLSKFREMEQNTTEILRDFYGSDIDHSAERIAAHLRMQLATQVDV